MRLHIGMHYTNDLDGTGTDVEILWYEHWDNFVNENVQRDGTDLTLAQFVIDQNVEITAFTNGLLDLNVKHKLMQAMAMSD